MKTHIYINISKSSKKATLFPGAYLSIKWRPLLATYDLWTGREVYRAKPVVSQASTFLLLRMTSEGYWARRPIQNITKPLMMLYYLKIFSVVYTMNIWNLHSKWHISVTANKCLIFFVISKVALGYHIERQLGNMNNFL